MNIDYKRDNFRFNCRTSSVIYNKDKTKVLLFRVEGRDYYLLPGGRIEELEESIHAIKREIIEEIGWDLEYEFFGVSEEFVSDKGFNNHQVTMIYKTVYNEEITNKSFKGLEGDWINFEWIDISDIDNYKIHPKDIIKYINNSDKCFHIVDNMINNVNKM